MGIYCVDVDRYKIFDSQSRDVFGMAHPQGTYVSLEVPTFSELKIISKHCIQIMIVYLNSGGQ